MDDLVLKPCPFCGGNAEIIHNAGGSCVSCTRCLASSNVEFERKENFVSNWNTRAADRIEALSDKGAMEPFMAIARAVTDEGSPEFLEWVRAAADWMVVFSFAGHSITLGQLRALAALRAAEARATKAEADCEALMSACAYDIDDLHAAEARAEAAEARVATLEGQVEEAREVVGGLAGPNWRRMDADLWPDDSKVTILDSSGNTIPDDWTVGDFRRAAAFLAKLEGETP